jgi:enamine deaminase RidA (YjgF/YER057c/UK114 family)
VSTVAERLAAAGFALPEPPAALGLYVPAVRAGSLVFTSGQLPFRDGRLPTSGLVGRDVDEETAAKAAEQAALNALAAAAGVCGLDEVTAVAKLTVYVASAPGFRAQPSVANGASRVIGVAFADVAAHARAAVGVAELPLGSPVEVELVLALS